MKSTIKYECEDIKVEDLRKLAPSYYDLKGVAAIPDNEFSALLKRELAENKKVKKGDLDMNCTLEQVDVTVFGKIVKFLIRKVAPLALAKGSSEANREMVRRAALDLPIRNMYGLTQGAVSKKSTEGLLLIFNGHFFKGIGKFFAGFKKAKKKEKLIIND